MSNELYHHGILGQKWGVRRYQNPDGSLTPAGRAKLGYSPEPRKKGLFSRKKKPKAKKETAQPKPQKSVNEMTLNELMDKKARLSLERDVLDLQTQIRSKNAQLNPTQKNAVKELAKEFATDTLKPAAKEASRKLLAKTIDDLLGTGDSQSLKAMEREILELQKKKTLRDLKNDMNEESSTNRLLEMEREISRLQKEKSLRDLRKDLNKTDEERAYDNLKRAAEKLKIESEMEKYRNIIRNGGTLNTKERWSLDNMTDEEKAQLFAILNAEGALWQSDYGNSDELYHHGILGQKWGVRRYQNEDGSLTEAGRKRYLNSDGTVNDKRISKQERRAARMQKKIDRVTKEYQRAVINRGKKARTHFTSDRQIEKYNNAKRKVDRLTAKKLQLELKNERKFADVDKLRDAAEQVNATIRASEDKCAEALSKVTAIVAPVLNNPKTEAKYKAMAAYADTINMNGPDATVNEFASNFRGMYDDFDQGSLTSMGVYLYDTNKKSQALSASNEFEKAQNEADAVNPRKDHDPDAHGYVLLEGLDSASFISSRKEVQRSIADAKKIVPYIKFPENKPWMFAKAVEAAGLGNVSIASMTPAQWNLINQAMADMTKR